MILIMVLYYNNKIEVPFDSRSIVVCSRKILQRGHLKMTDA